MNEAKGERLMSRRKLILAGVVGSTALATYAIKPRDNGAPHSRYFQKLSVALDEAGISRPTLVIDKEVLGQNIQLLKQSIGAKYDYRIVAKSLPSVLPKAIDSGVLPGSVGLARLMSWWNPNRTKTLFGYGGYWKAKPESPAGLELNPLFGRSTNQEMYNISSKVDIGADDWLFLRPTQSESVFLQFGEIAVYQDGRITDMWNPLGQSPA